MNIPTKPSKPLAGLHVIELMGIGPIPYAGHLLQSMGAQVTRINKAGGINLAIENHGKTSLDLNLQTPEGQRRVLDLIKTADILIEGARPSVAERLGLGPKDCHNINPALIYGRMTGWGQTGPWAYKAGHDINYIALSGALHAMGDAVQPPTPPLNLIGDYGGGSQFLVMNILAAVIERQRTGLGCVIDTAIIDGTASMMGIVRSLDQIGMWSEARGTNLLDGSRPYYRCFETKDGGYMAVGCLEPKFYAEMLSLLALDDFGGQNDPALWPKQIKILSKIFAAQPRAYWEALFENSDACVTPVLTYKEAPHHPQNKARQPI